MSRNTKEVALIQHRSGNLAEMPKALHQAEIGLAKDANRLFIGNAVNTILANRTEFPYQNLEILTEYSDLRDHFRYSYENNITKVADPNVERPELKEFVPIVITCENSIPGTGLAVGGTLSINGTDVTLATNDEIYDIVDAINAVSDNTKTYATVLQTSSNVYLTFFCVDSELVVEDKDHSGILETLGFPVEITYDISMPERKVTEKLDDTLHITDFGIKGDGDSETGCSQKIFNALLEVYKNYEDAQFYRNVMFPAGTYVYAPTPVSSSDTISTFSPFPLISNLHVHGEGIDRTIIKTANNIDSTYILVNGVDNQLNPETSANYGNGGYPNNILIEDLTFESNLNKLCVIDGITNITFNRVKFKGSTSTVLVDIIGKALQYSSNITFNECIFEGGLRGIYAETFAENVTITNCTFDSSYECSIKLGDNAFSDSALVKAININGNIIKNSPVHWDSSSGYAIEICRNVSYASIHQTQFEDTLFENWRNNTYPIPYFYSASNTYDTNFIDTLNPNTDEKKVLRFKFSQPTWEYLDYLINQSGNKVLVVDGDDSDVTAPNGLNIKESATTLDIRAVGTDAANVKISIENDSDLILGAGTDSESAVTGNIQIEKTLQLNDNNISNETGTGDITLKTARNKVVKVSQREGDTPYETLINNEPNALVNVAYVKRQIIDTYEKVITYKDIENISNGVLPLITFDPAIYGDNIHLKRIILNVRTPFYKTFEYIDKAVEYTSGKTYYAGDVVSGIDNGTAYAVVINTHLSDSSNVTDTNINVKPIPNQPTYKDVKYANVIGKNKILTQSYIEDYRDISTHDMKYPDIQMNNRFGYVNCDEFTNGYEYGGSGEDDAPKMVSYCDRNYILPASDTAVTYNDVDLHDDSTVLRKLDEGYTYIFEMDRDLNEGVASQNNPATVNYSNEKLSLAFYDKDKVQITQFNHAGQLNPGGKMIVRIEFLREEVNGAQ